MGRTVEESLQAVRELTGSSLAFDQAAPEIPTETAISSDNKDSGLIGRSFWAALVRGGYQGAVFYIDRLGGVIET
jgi:hypothetical protein